MRIRLLAFAPLLLTACSGGPAGEGGVCVSNRDCGDGFVCISGECFGASATTGCTDDTTCALGEYCDLTVGECTLKVPQACTDDTACGPDERCNTLTGVCIEVPRSCADGAACPEGRVCAEDTATCVECLDDTQCATDFVCENRQCVEEDKPPEGGCNDDSTCNPPLSICIDQMCSLGCAQPGGLTCEDGAVCDTSTGHCVTIEGPCTMDSDCTPPMTVCETGQCIPGCGQIGGVQCAGGEQCNPNTGRCQAGGDICVTDDDCNRPAEICNLFSGVCSPGCSTTGCTAPETCDTATGHCTSGAACTADRFEPNDSAAAAAQINGGAQTGLTVCPGDEDYYAVSLGQGDSVTVTVDFVAGEGNLDLALLGPNGQVVASSAGTTGTENLTFVASTPGVHVVRVYSVRDTGPEPGTTYTLQIRADVAPCPTDRYEDNDTDADAALILDGNKTGLNVCLGDEDFYDVILSGGETLEVDLTFSHAEGDIDAQILGLLGLPLASASSSTDNETLSYTAQNFGFFTIRVVLATDTGSVLGNPYDMDVRVTAAPPTPTPTCSADAFEDNDTAGTATVLSPGSQSGLNVCEADDDFYRYDLTAGDDVSVDLTFSHAEGDIDVSLIDPNGSVVASGTSGSDNESFAYTAADSGPHFLQVFLYADTGSTPGNTYNMNVGVTGSPTCVPDSYEPNDSIAAAASMSSGSHSGLTACEGDDDYYDITVVSGVTLNIDATFSDAEGDVDLLLYDPSGSQVASSLSTTDDESISYSPTQSGTFTVGVELYGDAGSVPGNTYSLSIQ